MNTPVNVYHPSSWLHQIPAGAKFYATRELCRLWHPEITDADVIETPYVGDASGIETNPPPVPEAA